MERRERQWLAEKATLEEYYEVSARNQRDAELQARDALAALRRENDAQLQLLQAARRALSDLRNRFDLAAASWNDERLRLQTAAEPVDRYGQRISELEKTIDRLTLDVNSAEAKCRAAENRLMAEESVWKTERTSLEEKLKKVPEPAAEPAKSSSSSASTRVSEFRSKFEKFGGKSKRSESMDEQQQQRHKSEMDAHQVSRQLQQQLDDVERTREEDRRQLLQRLEDQRATLGGEIKELRDRNATLEKKARESSQLQRQVVDLQCRLVEDRNQWQLEVSQLQRRFEESQHSRLQQKESISQLLAEVTRLRVLIGGLEAVGGPEMTATAVTSSAASKPRLRSLTPSAEKIRVLTLQQQQQPKAVANGNDSSKDQTILQDLAQAIETTSRLAHELSQPVQTTPRTDTHRTNAQSAHFKRSVSSAEVEATHGRPSDSWPHGSSTSTSCATPSRRAGLLRSSSQDDAESTAAASSGYATVDRTTSRRGTSSGAASNRGSFYASGTQSAYGSRDASPDTSTSGARRVTAYPAAPPSMIITPSQTPRRAASVDPDPGDQPLTSADILRLYEKLNAIERETEKDITLATATALLAAGRHGRAPTNGGASATATESSRPSAGVAEAKKPATSARSASVSPRSARRQFYDDYPYDPSKRAGAAGDSATGSTATAETTSRGPGRPDPVHAGRSSSVSRDDPLKSRLSSAASSLFQSIRDRRKLFGAKKSASVDSGGGVTRASIARIGANVLSEPAAPSTYQPPPIPDPQPTSRGRTTGGKLHRRTASIDAAAASADPSSHEQQERSSSVTRDAKRKV